MTTTGPAQVEDNEENAKLFTPLDHYNSAAAALQQIAEHHDEEDFGVSDATILIQLALTHGLLGQLKLGIDKAHRAENSF